MLDDIARCDREIADMLSQPPVQRAWLVTLGVNDWTVERALILQEQEPSPRDRCTAA